jgi:hypothetical protein
MVVEKVAAEFGGEEGRVVEELVVEAGRCRVVCCLTV